jgi:hypothetical protein
LSPEGGEHLALRKHKVEIGNSGLAAASGELRNEQREEKRSKEEISKWRRKAEAVE